MLKTTSWIDWKVSMIIFYSLENVFKALLKVIIYDLLNREIVENKAIFGNI